MEYMIGLLIAVIVGFVTYRDATKRGMKGWLWGFGTFLSMFPMLIIYLIMRRRVD